VGAGVPNTGWLLCDIYFTNGKPVPFSTRQICATRWRGSRRRASISSPGSKSNSICSSWRTRGSTPADATWPPQAPEVSLLNQGYQYLTESRFDQIDAALEPIRRGITALGMPLRSLEVELGPSQCEFTFRPQQRPGRRRYDDPVPRRHQTDRAAQRLSRELHVPAGAAQSVFERLASAPVADRAQNRRNAFAGDERDGLSAIGLHFLGGLLAHAQAAAAFTTPTVNGYKRYRAYTLAPDRAIWARDNRGVMVRVLGQPGDAATRLENRVGEPAANPYLYMASQIYAGLDGIARRRDPGPSADTPYETKAPLLPKNLGEALAALRASGVFRKSFGDAFVDYYARIKEAELARFKAESTGQDDVTAWEQNEYFDLF
jgi:glutamine synthetase